MVDGNGGKGKRKEDSSQNNISVIYCGGIRPKDGAASKKGKKRGRGPAATCPRPAAIFRPRQHRAAPKVRGPEKKKREERENNVGSMSI